MYSITKRFFKTAHPPINPTLTYTLYLKSEVASKGSGPLIQDFAPRKDIPLPTSSLENFERLVFDSVTY